MSREEQVKLFLQEVEKGLDKVKLQRIAPEIASEDDMTALFATIDYVTCLNNYRVRMFELSLERFNIQQTKADLVFYAKFVSAMYDIFDPLVDLVVEDIIKKYIQEKTSTKYFYLNTLAYLGGERANTFINKLSEEPKTEESVFHFLVALGIINFSALVKKLTSAQKSYQKKVFGNIEGLKWIDRALNILTELGARNLEHGDKQQADAYFKKPTELKPEDFKVWHNYAQYLMQVERFDESEEIYQKALNLEPMNPILLNDYGTLYFLQEEFAQARVHYKQAHEIAPENTLVLHNLGLVHLRLRNQRKAKGYFLRILEIEPTNIEAMRMLGMLQ